MGIHQSLGWVNYLYHKPEPHIVLFRRPLGTDGRTGKAPADWVPPRDERNDPEIPKPKSHQEITQAAQ